MIYNLFYYFFLEILNLLRRMNERLTILESKTDRLTVEITSIRNEVSSIKTKVYGDVSFVQHIVPVHPLISMEQYLKFDNQIENEEMFKEFVSIHFVNTYTNTQKNFFSLAQRIVFVVRNLTTNLYETAGRIYFRTN